MVLEDFLKKEREAVASVSAATVPNGPTLAENLRDKDRSILFGKMLEAEGPTGKDLAKRMLEPGFAEFGELQEKNKVLNETMNRIANVEAQLTPESIKMFAEQDPTLAGQLTLLGPEKFAEVMRSKLSSIAFGPDADRLVQMQQKLASHKRHREDPGGTFSTLNKDLRKKCEELKITEERFVDIMREDDPAKRVELFRKEIRAGLSGWWGKGSEAQKLASGLEGSGLRSRLFTERDEINRQLGEVGKLMSEAVEGNAELREAFMREVMDRKEPKLPEVSFRDAGREMQSTSQLVDGWEQEKATPEYRAYKSDAVKQQQHLDRWRGQVEVAHVEATKGRSFWAQVGLELLRMMLRDKKGEFKL